MSCIMSVCRAEQSCRAVTGWCLHGDPLCACPSHPAGLNMLQSGLHKQHMKDLFVELCLTVPVRLSSLLPYLPMLMDPLVSALNGSQTLVSQGLRTLELCVDNLQPDFLYDHIQPVRAELMQVSLVLLGASRGRQVLTCLVFAEDVGRQALSGRNDPVELSTTLIGGLSAG